MTRRVALVTGASSGLGAATAARLAAEGFLVAGLDLHPPSSSDNAEVRYLPCDVTDETAVANAVGEAAGWDGVIHVVVTCAGLAASELLVDKLGAASTANFRRTIDVNLLGTFNVLTQAAEMMAAQPIDENGVRGVLVTVGSLAARDCQRGTAAYAASKAGVAAMTSVAARDLAPLAIRCVGIAPGTMSTPMAANLGDSARHMLERSYVFPQRPGYAGEFARLVVALIDSHYINGAMVAMDGAAQLPAR